MDMKKTTKKFSIKKQKKDSNFYQKIINILKKIFKKRKIFNKKGDINYSFEEVIIIMLFSLGLGFFSCLSFVRIFFGGKNYLTLAKDLEKVVDTYYAIVDNYYGEVKTDNLIEGAINGMISAIGDNYTSYSNIEEASTFLETVKGVYEGIGCTIANGANRTIIIVSVYEDGPADKAGLKVNDIIIKVNDIDTKEKTSTELAKYIKESDSVVKLTILRNEEQLEINITKSSVQIPTISSKTYNKNDKVIGFINISLFSSVTEEQFIKALKKLEESNISGLVIDVRNNNGGYLNVVTDIIDIFLEKDKIIYQLEDSSGRTIIKDKTKEKRNYPIAILINKGSASASEILAAAIKESYSKGFVVGTNSYGKGTVQQTMTLDDGSMIKYTIQNWLTPKGNWLNEVGLEPTNIVEMDKEYYDSFNEEDDNQLQTALDLISK